MATKTPGNAVVLGSGISGMLATAALHSAGFLVTMVEREAHGTVGATSPQDAQLHNVLGRAQTHLEELFPDFRTMFLQAGGCVTSAPACTHVFELGVRMPERELGLEIWSAPRPVIADVVRGALAGLGAPSPVPARAIGLVVDGERCVGVKVEGSESTVMADLVVDATGAASQVPKWLAQSASGPVPTQEFEARQWYTTVQVERPEHWQGRNEYWLVFPHRSTRGGLVSPLGPDRWVVSLSGTQVDPPPSTYKELVIAARGLEDPWIWERLVESRPTSGLSTFRKPVSTWRRYDLMKRPVTGVVAVGDALCGLNPLYGQGISVAAWEAALLRDLLHQGSSGAELTGAYHRAAAQAVSAAWSLMTSQQRDKGSDLADVDWDAVRSTVLTDQDAHRAYVEVWHLLRPATWLTTAGKG